MLPYFVILPITNSESPDIEAVYLKSAEDINFSSIISQTKILKGEDATLYYDPNKLTDFLLKLKTKDNNDDYPSKVKFIRKEINDWEEIEPLYDSPIITDSNVKINKGVACAFHNNHSTNKVLVDTGEFIIKGAIPNTYSIIPCKDSELFTCLAKNRESKRVYDTNYEKHSKKSKITGKGIVSPIEYNNDDINEKLQWAVGEEKGRMFLHDLSKKKILVFWFENVSHLYHAFNVNDDDKGEIKKIWKQGGRRLFNKIERVAQIYQEKKDQ